MKTLTAEEQTKGLPMIATPKLIPMSPDQARKKAREAYMRMCIYIDTQRSEDDAPFVPELSQRTFTRSQLESGFANYPEPKANMEPKRRRTGERQRRHDPVINRKPKPVEPTKVQLIKNILTEHGPQTNVQIAEESWVGAMRMLPNQ